MKDETKEIKITFPGQILDYVDTKEHLLELFNYITNLQEELELERIKNKSLLNTTYGMKINANLQKELKLDSRDLLIFISNYIDRINHILENGDKRYLRENLTIVINYMNEYLNEIFTKI